MNFFNQKFEKNALLELACETKLDEPIDYDCQFVVARDREGKICGLVGFNLKTMKYPRLEHCIVLPKYQKTGLIVKLLEKMEEYIFKFLQEGCYVSYILDTNERMKIYAQKWGMKPFQNDEQGTFFFKANPIKEKKLCA